MKVYIYSVVVLLSVLLLHLLLEAGTGYGISGYARGDLLGATAAADDPVEIADVCYRWF